MPLIIANVGRSNTEKRQVVAGEDFLFSCTRGRCMRRLKRDQFTFRQLCWEALVDIWVYRHNISRCFSDVLSPVIVGAPDSCPTGYFFNPVLVTGVTKWRPCQEKCFVLAVHKLFF